MNRNIKVPDKIDPCPIIEALIEIRFDASIPPEAVFGVVYSKLKSEFPGKVDNLPILQLPHQVREFDAALKFSPWYKLQKEDLIVQIGPRVISFSNINEYKGWSNLFPIIRDLISKIQSTELFTFSSRIGLRYINYFPMKVFEKSTLGLKINDEPFNSIDLSIRSTIESGKFKAIVNMVDNAQVSQRNTLVSGSVIDIDTYLDGPILNEKILDAINEAHTEEKIIFFNLLKPEFVESLRTKS